MYDDREELLRKIRELTPEQLARLFQQRSQARLIRFEEQTVPASLAAFSGSDYSIAGSKIRLFLFDDRLELYSPGPLPNSVTVDSLSLRQSTRNELITSLLARCPVAESLAFDVHRRYFMEKRGDGVPIILHESRELSGREPEYRLIDEQELLLTIWSAELPNQPTASP